MRCRVRWGLIWMMRERELDGLVLGRRQSSKWMMGEEMLWAEVILGRLRRYTLSKRSWAFLLTVLIFDTWTSLCGELM